MKNWSRLTCLLRFFFFIIPDVWWKNYRWIARSYLGWRRPFSGNGCRWWRSSRRTPRQKGSLDNVPLMLVGNKCDETESRELTAKEGEEQARRWSSHFMETSAKNNHNVKELFQVSWLRFECVLNSVWRIIYRTNEMIVLPSFETRYPIAKKKKRTKRSY